MTNPVIGLRRLFVHDETVRARAWHDRLTVSAHAGETRDLQNFIERMSAAPDNERVLLGRARDGEGNPLWVGLPPEQLLGMHSWITGATGSGKSFFVLGMLLQVLARGRHPVIVFDCKGELADLLVEVVVPALCHMPEAEPLLRRLRVIRPFDRTYLPLLRITHPEPHVPAEVQAYTLASALEESLADDLGARMHRTFLKAALLAVRLNVPLTEIAEWLQHPTAFIEAARRAGDRATLDYALHVFPQENRSSIDALLARLDTFLFLESTRLALAAPSCVSFADALEGGLTIIDVGNPPAGAERVARFWAGILAGRLARAVLSRPVTQGSPQAWLVFEEFQEALGRDQVEQFGRLLALARFKRVGLAFVNQQTAQVAAADPTLVKLLRTNIGLEAAFRCSYEDAQSFAHALPMPAVTKHPAEVRQALVQAMTQLPGRTYYMHLRDAAFRAQQVRSPRLAIDDLRRAAGEVPAELREFIRRGVVALRREELQRQSNQAQRRGADRAHPFLRADRTPDGEQFPGLG